MSNKENNKESQMVGQNSIVNNVPQFSQGRGRENKRSKNIGTITILLNHDVRFWNYMFDYIGIQPIYIYNLLE